jgi:hypothetical protein
MHGGAAIPTRWCENGERGTEIEARARDLWCLTVSLANGEGKS